MPDKKPDWNTQTKISIILGVSRQAVQKLCKGKFKPAVGTEGKEKGKINLWHPIVQQHKAELEAKKAAVAGPRPSKTKPASKPKTKQSLDTYKQPVNGEIPTFEDVENMTIRQMVERYGSIEGFKNYVATLDKMAAWKNRELKYEQSRKKLVEINPVATSLFSIVDLAFRRIVTEYPTTVTAQLMAIALRDDKTSSIDMIELQTQTLSKILKSVKREVQKGLDDAGKD